MPKLKERAYQKGINIMTIFIGFIAIALLWTIGLMLVTGEKIYNVFKNEK